MKTILIPTDFSQEADNAVLVAASIAKKMPAAVHFLNVIEPLGGDSITVTGGVDDSAMDNLFMLKLIERNQKEVARRANRSDFMEIETKGVVRVDEIYNQIKEYSAEHNVSLVIMGSKGSSGLQEVLVGSNAERVTRYSQAPVLVVKQQIEEFNPKNIVYATNSEAGSEAVIEVIKQFQAMYGATVHIMNVNTPNNFYRTRTMHKMLNDFAIQHSLNDYTVNIYNDSNEEDGIIHFADDINADLIVIGTHARTGLSRLLSSNISEDVVNHSQRPVLTVKIG